jgi:hypothetical protein
VSHCWAARQKRAKGSNANTEKEGTCEVCVALLCLPILLVLGCVCVCVMRVPRYFFLLESLPIINSIFSRIYGYG